MCWRRSAWASASPKTMRIDYSGELGFGVTAKDLILATIGRLGVGGMRATRSSTRASRSAPSRWRTG